VDVLGAPTVAMVARPAAFAEQPIRDRRRVTEAIGVAAIFSGLPSTLHAFITGDGFRSAVEYVYDATCAVGTLVPPGRPGFKRGALVHLGISAACGELLARALPQRHSVAWGAAAGLAIGVINLGMIGRKFSAIRALPIVPGLADNVAFGALFAVVADRRDRELKSVATATNA
jgi:hypothetical protein